MFPASTSRKSWQWTRRSGYGAHKHAPTYRVYCVYTCIPQELIGMGGMPYHNGHIAPSTGQARLVTTVSTRGSSSGLSRLALVFGCVKRYVSLPLITTFEFCIDLLLVLHLVQRQQKTIRLGNTRYHEFGSLLRRLRPFPSRVPIIFVHR